MYTYRIYLLHECSWYHTPCMEGLDAILQLLDKLCCHWAHGKQATERRTCVLHLLLTCAGTKFILVCWYNMALQCCGHAFKCC